MGRLFTYCRIGCQIAVLGLVGLFGMAGVEGINWWGIQRTDASAAAVAQARGTVLLLEQLEVGMLQARRHEKDLQLRQDEASARKHADAMQALGRDFEALRTVATQPDTQAPVAAAMAGAERYRLAFERMAAAMREIGLNENSGLQGRLRGAIREVEARTAKVEALAVQVSILMSRRHEKDYLARGDARYVAQLQAELATLGTALDAAGLAPEERADLGAKVGLYRDSFLALVQARTRLGEATAELSRSYAEVEAQLNTVQEMFGRLEEAEVANGERSTAETRQLALSVAGAIALAVLFLSWWIGRGIARPVVAVTAAMEGLAAGRLDTPLPQDARHDELGQMIRTLATFRDGLAEAQTLREQQMRERETAAEQRVAAMQAMADRIEADAADAVMRVDAQATAMSQTAGEMRRIAEHTGASAHAASHASDEAMNNAQTVASATEQLSASIREIGQQVNQSTTVVAQAVAATGETHEVFGDLTARVADIGTVVELISEIAARTNLLALNATIEAARAGEAGKGFAVVASEVKTLATQTARSTQEIARHIGGVRSATDKAVAAMARIEANITNVNGIASSIAAAVEQQGAATAEIARAVSDTSATVNVMSARNAEVAADAERTGAYAGQVQDTSATLTDALQDLRRTLVRTVRTTSADVDRRAGSRVAVNLSAQLDLGAGARTVRVADLSEGGARVADAGETPAGRRGTLRAEGLPPLQVETLGMDGAMLRLVIHAEGAQLAALHGLVEARLGRPAAA